MRRLLSLHRAPSHLLHSQRRLLHSAAGPNTDRKPSAPGSSLPGRRLTRSRIESQILAIDCFLQILVQEFADFSGSRAGSIAIANLLAREVLVLRPLAIETLLSAKTCEIVRRLEATYVSMADGIDYRQWLGTNFVSRDIYPRSKQLHLLYGLLRDRMSPRSS